MDILGFLQANMLFSLVCIAVIGLAIGSFLNVVVSRYPMMLYRQWREECEAFMQQPQPDTGSGPLTLSTPRSRCPKCKTPIKVWQNIPVISYLLLGGKCAQCKNPISLLYPFIELLTAVLSVLVVVHFGIHIQTVLALVFTWLLLGISFIDIKEQIIPDNMNYILLWLGLAASIFHLFTQPTLAITGALIGYLFLWGFNQLFSWLRKKQGMGHGDFKLFAALGAWLGVGALLDILLIAAILGAVIGTVRILVAKFDKENPFSFGPYLALAGWVVLMYGNVITKLINHIMS